MSIADTDNWETDAMAFLTKLTIVAAKRIISQSPEEIRRAKLLAKLMEQHDLADAMIAGTTHSVTRDVWVKDEQGSKTRVTKPKRMRSWFWLNTDGKWLLEVRYGSKALELSKGKRAIEVGARGELPATIRVIQEAVRAGELDAQMEAVAAMRKLKLPKS